MVSFNLAHVCLLIAGFAAAAPGAQLDQAGVLESRINRPGAGYGQFCDDLDCKKNCGTHIDLVNGDQCLHEHGRKSIFVGGGIFDYTFEKFPKANCGGKRKCVSPIPAGCLPLNGYSYGVSFGQTGSATC